MDQAVESDSERGDVSSNPSSTFETRSVGEEGSPIHTPLSQLHADIALSLQATDAFLRTHYEEARSLIKPRADSGSSLYGSLSMGILLVIRSLLTFAPEDVVEARQNLDRAIEIGHRMKKALSASTITSRLTKIFARRKTRSVDIASLGVDLEALSLTQPDPAKGPAPVLVPETDIEAIRRHAELVIAEATLVRALLLVVADSHGGWILLLREALNIRSSYLIYHEAFMRMATARSSDQIDPHYESGILLGNGLLNMLFSLLPPRIATVFSFLGYMGSDDVGISQLKAAAACEGGVRSAYAELLLLLYYNVFAGILAVRPGADSAYMEAPETQLVMDILNRRLREYPQCPVYLYFRARHLVLRSDLPGAIDVLEETLSQKPDWPQLLHTCAWELMATSMVQLRWDRCLEMVSLLARENRWSRAFYIFLQAVFLNAHQYQKSPDPETREQVFSYLARVPSEVKRVVGRRIAVEKYAAWRSREALESGEVPFKPEYELMLIWDVFMRATAETLDLVLEELAQAEKEGLREHQRLLVILIRAAIHRVKEDYQTALELLQQALKFKMDKEFYLLPLAHLEWSQVALQSRDLKTARIHYEISAGYPHRYILQRSLELRQTKVKAELDRLSSGH